MFDFRMGASRAWKGSYGMIMDDANAADGWFGGDASDLVESVLALGKSKSQGLRRILRPFPKKSA
ncbi:MAG: hypothetical protein AAGB46_02060 [Verrucomicrobiota bacterium]